MEFSSVNASKIPKELKEAQRLFEEAQEKTAKQIEAMKADLEVNPKEPADGYITKAISGNLD